MTELIVLCLVSWWQFGLAFSALRVAFSDWWLPWPLEGLVLFPAFWPLYLASWFFDAVRPEKKRGYYDGC